MATHYVTFSYNANGGNGAPATSSSYYNNTSNVYPYIVKKALATGRPYRTYYNFLGWATYASATSSQYSPGAEIQETFAAASDSQHSRTFYAVWGHQYATCTFDANGGSGAPSAITHYAGYAIDIPTTIPTRAAYDFAGWATSADAESAQYSAGQKGVALYTTITLYAVWKKAKSILDSYTDPLPIDGATQGTLQIHSYYNEFSHVVTISLGSSSQTFENVATSLSYTLPVSWLDELPNSVSGYGTIKLSTYEDEELIGEQIYTFEATVPSSVKPTFTVVSTFESENQIVDNWNVLVQGYSTLELVVTASAGRGASIVSYSFSGPGMSQVGSLNSCTSAILSDSGSKTWTIIVTDSRGRSATSDIVHIVYDYSQPSSIISAVRCNHDGTENNLTGNYLKVIVNFNYSSVNGNNALTSSIKYKQSISDQWITGQQSISSGISYIIGPVTLISYDVKVAITDSLNGSTASQAFIPSVLGFGYGLNNDRACFGGPCEEPGLVTKWPFKAKDGIYMGANNTSLLDMVYPVGSVYISADSTFPSTFLGGTWIQLQDVTVVSGGSVWQRTS